MASLVSTGLAGQHALMEEYKFASCLKRWEMWEMPFLLMWKFLLNEKGGKENEHMMLNLCSARALKTSTK